MKQGIEQLANLLKNINKTVEIFTQQSKWTLQGGIAAISKNFLSIDNQFTIFIEIEIFGRVKIFCRESAVTSFFLFF